MKFPDEWRKEVTKVMEQHGLDKPPLPILTGIAKDQLSVTVAELSAWWDALTT